VTIGDFTKEIVELDYLFRAKGLFAGPLTMGIFASYAPILLKNNYRYILIAFLCCFFANSRTGMIIIIVVSFLNNSSRKNLLKILPLFIAIVSVALLVIKTGFVSDYAIERITSTFDFQDSSSNLDRLFYWISSIDHFKNYSLANKIFGNNGSFAILFLNNSESGWLSLLVDNGIIGLSFYLLTFIYITLHSFRKNMVAEGFTVIFIFVVMTVFTFHLSRISNFLLWFYIFSLQFETGKKFLMQKYSINHIKEK
jgi:ABC-type multidrug transport system fused ATPase/permease subunit